MARFRIQYGKLALSGNMSVTEGRKAAIPCLLIASSAGLALLSGALIYHKYKTAIDHKPDKGMLTEYANDSNGMAFPASSASHCGCPSADLFNHASKDESRWIVDGYMKVGQVNILASGASTGKSIITYQIALATAKGIRPEFLPENCVPSVKSKVFIYRLENYEGELEGKYGNGKVFEDSGITWLLPDCLPELSLDGFIAHLKGLASTLTEDTLVCIDPATKLDGYTHARFIKGVEEAMNIAKTRNVVMTIVGTIHLDEIKDWSQLTGGDIKGGDRALQQAGSVTAIRRERTDVETYRFLQCLKEPKGSPKPFEGRVLVLKAVETVIDDNNKFLYYQHVGIKQEELARPVRPIVQTDDISNNSYSVSSVPAAPNQKVTPEIEQKIRDMLKKQIKPKKIAKATHLSEKTIRRYKKKMEEETT